MQTPLITVVYSHGRNSSPWYGHKILVLREVALSAGINMISVRYPETQTVPEMEQTLFNTISDDVAVPGDLIFLGSSRGAYLSLRAASRAVELFAEEGDRFDADRTLPRRHVLGQFLIAPPFYVRPETYPDQSPTPPPGIRTEIVHGLDDDTIDCEHSIRFARTFGATLHLLPGGHRLHSQDEKLSLLFGDFLKQCTAESFARSRNRFS